MIFLANVVAVAILAGIAMLFKTIEWNWGQQTMVVFCLGWIAATVMWQTVHKMRYGHWFDDRPINGDNAGAAENPRGNGV